MTQQTPNFIQLTPDECTYLITLIHEIDNDTTYTARQRGYTIPKLMRIKEDPRSAKLAYQDVDYLLELLEDTGAENQGNLVSKLESIRDLQDTKYAELKSIEDQRTARRLKASARTNDLAEELQRHFTKTTVQD